MKITAEQIAASKTLAKKLHDYLLPLVIGWMDEHKKTNDEKSVLIAVSAEAMMLAAVSHIGDAERFAKMAHAAFEARGETTTTTH
jgi:hypothetical protein